MQILTANHWTEPGNPNGRVRGRAEGAEGDHNLIGRTTASINWAPQSFQGLNHQPRIYMGWSMTPTIYGAEDCFICHQWEGMPLVPWRFDAPEKGSARGVRWE